VLCPMVRPFPPTELTAKNSPKNGETFLSGLFARALFLELALRACKQN
jgi:hypothetical protein